MGVIEASFHNPDVGDDGTEVILVPGAVAGYRFETRRGLVAQLGRRSADRPEHATVRVERALLLALQKDGVRERSDQAPGERW